MGTLQIAKGCFNLLSHMAVMKPLKEILVAAGNDDCGGLAAEMAFHFILSLVPLLIFLVSLLAIIGNETNMVTELFRWLQRMMVPHQTLQLLRDLVNNVIEHSTGSVALLSLGVALWTASNGAAVTLKGIHRTYDMENGRTDKFIFRRLLGIAVVVVMGLTLFIALNVLVGVRLVMESIQQYVYVPFYRDTWLSAPWLQWLIPFLALVIFATVLYGIVPFFAGRDAQFELRKILPGALVFVTLWLVGSWVFQLYIDNFTNYGEIYGALGSIVIFMLWAYFSSYALLIGGEVNGMLIKSDKSQAVPKAAAA